MKAKVLQLIEIEEQEEVISFPKDEIGFLCLLMSCRVSLPR